MCVVWGFWIACTLCYGLCWLFCMWVCVQVNISVCISTECPRSRRIKFCVCECEWSENSRSYVLASVSESWIISRVNSKQVHCLCDWFVFAPFVYAAFVVDCVWCSKLRGDLEVGLFVFVPDSTFQYVWFAAVARRWYSFGRGNRCCSKWWIRSVVQVRQPAFCHYGCVVLCPLGCCDNTCSSMARAIKFTHSGVTITTSKSTVIAYHSCWVGVAFD